MIDILRNEDPVYGNASAGSVTTQGEEIGEEESCSKTRVDTDGKLVIPGARQST